MTEKELLYVDDALSHAQFLKQQCDESAAKLSDADLKNFVSQLSTEHQAAFGRFYGLL